MGSRSANYIIGVASDYGLLSALQMCIQLLLHTLQQLDIARTMLQPACCCAVSSLLLYVCNGMQWPRLQTAVPSRGCPGTKGVRSEVGSWNDEHADASVSTLHPQAPACPRHNRAEQL